MKHLNKETIYLHTIFILAIWSSRPIFNTLYNEDYHFKWSFEFHPLTLLFYALVLTVIYFTAFAVLRERNTTVVKFTGFMGTFFLFIPLRWLVDQQLSYWLFGITNYPTDTSFSFYFHDNLVVSFAVVMTGLFLKFMNDWYVNGRIKSNLEKQNLQLELSFLKSQVNPHFLFNTLNNIQSYILQDDKMKSVALIGQLSDFMRFALYECNEEFIDLQKEISMLEDYVALERVRCDDRVEISFDTMGNFSEHTIPPLILIPFVENAFKHGAEMQNGQAWIRIFIAIDKGTLQLKVENNHLINSWDKPTNGGIGLTNIKRRLQYYFPGKHVLQIDNDHQVFTVNLNIDL
jgi:two-component system LytT family sensor kinase